MKKRFQYFLTTLACCACLSACRIGGGTIYFDANGASYNPQPVNLNNGATLDKLPTISKIGYNFVGWCYDKELTRLAVAPVGMATDDYTLYAKYKVNEDYFIYHKIAWTENPSMDFSTNGYREFLLNVLPSIGSLGKISLMNTTSSQSFAITSVCDYNGVPLSDKNPLPEVWEPATPLSNTLPNGETYLQYVIYLDITQTTNIHVETV